MSWITPKTNWVASDFVNTSDFSRITGNLEHLKTLIKNVSTVLPSEQTINDYPFARKLNAIEQALEQINLNSYAFDIGDTKTYVANGHPFDYQELNRIESATAKIYYVYLNQLELSRHLSFRLGNTRMFDCPRQTTQSANADVMGNRLAFELGEERGEYND